MARVMTDERMKRITEEAEFYLKEGQTLRTTAAEFVLSKSQIQTDFELHLKEIGRPDLYTKVKAKMEENLKLRHHNGGKNRWKNHKKKEVTHG